jgi:hypothetical protein
MGLRQRVEETIESVFWLVDIITTSLASDDNDVQARIDDSAGTGSAETTEVELWGVAGLQSRPKDGSASVGYAKALRVQLGDTVLVIGTHDPRHVEVCQEGELLIHALGLDGAERALVRLKPDGTVEIDGVGIYLGASGATEGIGLGDTIKSHFDQVKTWMTTMNSTYDNHIHTTTATVSTGSPGTIAPTVSSGPSPPSVPTVASAKHKVEP